MPDIKIGNDAIARLQSKFAAAAATPTTPLNRSTLVSLQHDCSILINLIDELIEVDWLADANLQYDLSTYSPAQIDDFKEVQKLAFQQEIDSSTLKGYTIVRFDFVPVAGGVMSRASAFLSPPAKRGQGGPGGGQGTVNPGYPPK